MQGSVSRVLSSVTARHCKRWSSSTDGGLRLLPPASISVIGSGRLGTALAKLAGDKLLGSKASPEIKLFTRNREVREEINIEHTNKRYISRSVGLPFNITAVDDLNQLFAAESRHRESDSGPHVLVLATPPESIPEVVGDLKKVAYLPQGGNLLVILASKGLVTRRLVKHDIEAMASLRRTPQQTAAEAAAAEESRAPQPSLYRCGYNPHLSEERKPRFFGNLFADNKCDDESKCGVKGSEPQTADGSSAAFDFSKEAADAALAMEYDVPLVLSEYLARTLQCEVGVLGGFNSANELLHGRFTEAFFLSRFEILNAYAVGLLNALPMRIYTHALETPKKNEEEEGDDGLEFEDCDEDEDDASGLRVGRSRRGGDPPLFPKFKKKKKRKKKATPSINPDLFVVMEMYSALKDVVAFGSGVLYAESRSRETVQSAINETSALIRRANVELEAFCAEFCGVDFERLVQSPIGLEKLRFHLQSELASACSNGHAFVSGALLVENRNEKRTTVDSWQQIAGEMHEANAVLNTIKNVREILDRHDSYGVFPTLSAVTRLALSDSELDWDTSILFK